MEKKLAATFGAADAVVAVVHARLTVWRAFLAQLSSRVSKGARRTPQHTRTFRVQEISCGTNKQVNIESTTGVGNPKEENGRTFETRSTIQRLWAKAGLTGCVTGVTLAIFSCNLIRDFIIHVTEHVL